MIRIAGVILPENKKADIALSYLYGIGPSLARDILTEFKIDINTKLKDIDEETIEKLRQHIEKKYRIEGDLKVEVSQNIKRLKEISSYRGLRHILNLPVRGQRTKTNSRTKRGRRVTVGSGRRKAADKT